MKLILKLLSLIGLLLTALPPILFFMDQIELSSCKSLMVSGMICWFVSAPFWINSSKEATQHSNYEN